MGSLESSLVFELHMPGNTEAKNVGLMLRNEQTAEEDFSW